jgi:hypothetical protein
MISLNHTWASSAAVEMILDGKFKDLLDDKQHSKTLKTTFKFTAFQAI